MVSVELGTQSKVVGRVNNMGVESGLIYSAPIVKIVN
jgi:hypothetical protein